LIADSGTSARLTVTTNGSERPSSSSSGVATSEYPNPVTPPRNEAQNTITAPARSVTARRLGVARRAAPARFDVADRVCSLDAQRTRPGAQMLIPTMPVGGG
jgi:hypothetical protein